VGAEINHQNQDKTEVRLGSLVKGWE